MRGPNWMTLTLILIVIACVALLVTWLVARNKKDNNQ